MRTRRVILRRFDNTVNDWVSFYPRVDGGNVTGTVPNAARFGDQPPEAYMPARQDALRVVDDNGQATMLRAGRLVVSTLASDEPRAQENSVFVRGNIYANDGQRVATMVDISDLATRMVNTRVNQAVEADRLATPVKINGVTFDGTRDISISGYTVSTTAPADTTRFWVHRTDRTLNYFDGTTWQSIVGVWG